MKKAADRDPFLKDSVEFKPLNEKPSESWMRYLVAGVAGASVFCLVILIILLAIPITVLAIGVRYRDPRYCPIEPRISLFLIVNGSVSLAWIFITILITIMTIVAAYNRSLVISVILPAILSIIIFVSMIFSIIWLIIGSVWTFSVYKRVTHQYDVMNYFYPYNYCHALLIISYVFIIFQCCFQCFNNVFRSKKQ
jgi:hypothetical protein